MWPIRSRKSDQILAGQAVIVSELRSIQRKLDIMAQGQTDFQASLATLQQTISGIASSQAKALADAKAAWEADDEAKWEAAHAQLDALNTQLTAAPTPTVPADPGAGPQTGA